MLPAREKPAKAVHPLNRFVFSEPVDASGQAKIRGHAMIMPSSSEIYEIEFDDLSQIQTIDCQVTLVEESTAVTGENKSVSRTTAWRKRKAEADRTDQQG